MNEELTSNVSTIAKKFELSKFHEKLYSYTLKFYEAVC